MTEKHSYSRVDHESKSIRKNIRCAVVLFVWALALWACSVDAPANSVELPKSEIQTPELDASVGLIPVSGQIMTTFHEWVGPLKRHTGIDIQNEVGALVVSPLDGEITFTQVWTDPNDSFGNNVDLSYGDRSVGCVISFGHLQDFVVEQGQVIKRGDPIGHLGDSGLNGVFPPHLHIESFCLHPTPGYINPALIIPGFQNVQVGDSVEQGAVESYR